MVRERISILVCCPSSIANDEAYTNHKFSYRSIVERSAIDGYDWRWMKIGSGWI